MGQKEEGIGAWEKEWFRIILCKDLYPYKSEALKEAPPYEWGFF